VAKSPVGTFELADEHAECLLIGIDRKWPTCAQNVEIDPMRTFQTDDAPTRF
jgi:hypothetical protein